MTQLLVKLMLEGISLSIQNDGVMLVIYLEKDGTKVHTVVPVVSVEHSSLSLQECVNECRQLLYDKLKSSALYPEFPPVKPMVIK